MHAEHDPRDRILGFLGALDRRLRRNDAIRYLGQALWGVVAVLLLMKLTGVWGAETERAVVLGVVALVVIGFVAWGYRREGTLVRPAAVADRGADLKDALKSALAFLGLDERTEWMELHIERSAATAETLSPAELAPMDVPRPVYYGAGVMSALLTLFLWNPAWFQELEEAKFLTASQEDRVEPIAELLDEAEALAPEEEKLEELSQALEQLRRRDLELSESLQELGEAQEALAASRAEMERLEMDLEELGAQLESAPALSELAEALKSQNAEEAAELLRQLAERLADAETSEELQALLEALKNANVENQELAEMMESLEQSAGDMSAQELAQMAQALESMAQQMEQMGQQVAAQQDMEQGQEVQQLEASLGQQAGEQQQMGQQQQAAGQAMQSQAGMMSNQVQMAQMQGDPASAVPVDAGPAGNTTGPGGPGEEQVFGESTTLEVQLEMEVLSTEERDKPVPEEVFERLSREEKSTLNYEDVQQRGSFAEETAMEGESVPWPYRSLVKRYFLSILTQTSESTSEP